MRIEKGEIGWRHNVALVISPFFEAISTHAPFSFG